MQKEESWENTATLDGDETQVDRRVEAVESVRIEGMQRKSGFQTQGLRDIVAGSVLIAIGLVFGGSVFTGDPTALDWFFDVLGSFWILKGLYTLFTQR
ncbi:MAG: hypothetical protein ACYTGV_00195 [Planctomycetota bacterium]|jgi:hypothetical protein